MLKIQTLDKIDPAGIANFPLDQYEVASEFSKPDGIILRSFKMHDMELPSSLKAIARAGAGVNNIPIQKCTEKGIVVFNTLEPMPMVSKRLSLLVCCWLQGILLILWLGQKH